MADREGDRGADAKDGGIGANVDTIKKVLEEHPDVFESRTGDAAKELGRKPNATLWGLKKEPADGEALSDEADEDSKTA